ncbi:MAG: hypothetical protein FGM55_09815 [Rhodoferax sp.]|nr:hypothetical protein [Rhodoferax sp.]
MAMAMSPVWCGAWSVGAESKRMISDAFHSAMQVRPEIRSLRGRGIERFIRSGSRAAIQAAHALRIERWLGRDHGGAAEVWLAQQAGYGLWQARAVVKASTAPSGVKALKLQTA